jgi:NAD(P)-dependent dehydrogenase (short-subunit alcohol dehydrogenase family)
MARDLGRYCRVGEAMPDASAVRRGPSPQALGLPVARPHYGSMRAIIVSASSDIGLALAERWRAAGHDVVGTYRRRSAGVAALEASGVPLVRCALDQPESVREATSALGALCPAWDVLVLAAGTLEPVGSFLECNFDDWVGSVGVNFTGQMRMLHALLPTRRKDREPGPLVMLFAGGGTNGAPVNYSAYTVSKIALAKMCELLDAEVPDTRFSILGPGWVKTKIHAATLAAGTRAGANRDRTLVRLAGDDCTPMDEVLDCCDWLVGAPREVVGGRNFSVAHDRWRSEDLLAVLRRDAGMYKLRRSGNERLPRHA